MSLLHTKLSLNLFKHARVESESAQFGRDARADWQVVCFVFLFFNFVAIGMSVFVYQQITKGELFLVDKKEHVSLRTVDRFELERTVSFFSEKKQRFEALKEHPLSTADPFVVFPKK